jgi:hypothetical protein
MKCAKSIVIRFSGITFDGSPYGISDDVNRTFEVPNDKDQTKRLGFCKFYYKSADTVPFFAVSVDLTSPNKVGYAYYYWVNEAEESWTEAPIFQGTDASKIVPNTEYPANGGTATIISSG